MQQSRFAFVYYEKNENENYDDWEGIGQFYGSR